MTFNKSILVIGPPETGKSSFLKSLPVYQNALFVDLENTSLVMQLLKRRELIEEILSEVEQGQWLTITRIDRIAKYFPLIIAAIKNKKIFIVATACSLENLNTQEDLSDFFQFNYCSSMRFSALKNTTSLIDILSFGTLPKIYNLEKTTDKIHYLKNYVQDFLDLEIILRSQVRNLVPFHLFLPLCAEHVGKKVNYSSLAQDLNVDYKTIQNYFDLLVSNHVGFCLESYNKAIRKFQIQSPRFYFFDCGFHRAISNKIDSVLIENSTEYQQMFKAWCIAEVKKCSATSNRELKLSKLDTKHGVSIDLIIEEPLYPTTLVVFVSARRVLPKHLKNLLSIGKSVSEAKLVCVTNSPHRSTHGPVEVIPYDQFILEYQS